jgi:lipopolysaccharide biosynthesis regulator YciM
MTEWLPWMFLAALACFGLGWLAARIDLGQLLRESRAMPSAYFKGLNFLMNEEPDKAIDAFIEVSRAHPEVVELHFALGALFRRRGEADRAIRVHQDLIERSGIDASTRAAATLELARDYQKAGLLDHAEKTLHGLLGNLAQEDARCRDALVLLKDICVQAREWDRAIAAVARLQRDFLPDDRRLCRERAQLHCERAEELHRSDPAAAQRELQAALEADPHCVRATLIEGDWLAARGEHEAALTAWRAIEQQSAAHLGLAAGRVLSSAREAGLIVEGIGLLERWQQVAPSLELMRVLLEATREREGAEAAARLAQRQLQAHPTLVGLDRVLAARAALAVRDAQTGEETALHRKVVHTHAERLAAYLCSDCGFKSRQYFWHCPACGGWDTFPPRLTAEMDTAERHLFHEHASASAQAKEP